MKCKLLYEREVVEFEPGTTKPLAPAYLVKQCVRRGKRLFAPAGTIIDDPQAFWIVLQGQAEPADEDCVERTACSPEQLAERLHAARRLNAGIEPDDFPLFDKGYIAGYDANGEYLPGPNWDEYQKQLAAAVEKDEGI